VETFDVVVLGAGSGGVRLAGQRADRGRSVAVVEAGRVGGECPYTACIPSKALLRSASARHDARRLTELGGASRALELDPDRDAWAAAVRRREERQEHLDDSAAARSLQDRGVVLVRGRGTVTPDGAEEVADRLLRGPDHLHATGADAVRLDAFPDAWTSEDALTSDELPATLLVVGGGAIGCELAQVYARFGVHVTLVESSGQLLGKEEPRVAAAVAALLRDDGVDVRLGTDAEGLTAERVLVAVGKRPHTDAVAALGLPLTDDGAIDVDDRCRAAEHVYAVGDVTAASSYTHTANYQADVVTDVLTGVDRRADLTAVPRCVYTDPPVASVGSLDAAHTACVDLAEVPRSTTDGVERGLLVLASDGEVLTGASVFGLHADELLAEATLAVKARVPLTVLADVIRPFPTVGEAYLPAVQQLIASARR
jgi:dihydrolipoamide dehydrogenase